MARGSRLRMIGGPNGSGKSTLLAYLSALATQEHFPLGFVQNPDALQREIAASKRLYLGTWSVETTSADFSNFVASHPLFTRIEPPRTPTIMSDAMVFRSAKQLGYMIPVLCDFFRQRWVERGESFTFETVMSGGDKVELLRQAREKGYRTYLYFICTDDVLINEERIKSRVKQGGHSVPRDKVLARYTRSLSQLPSAIAAVDRAYMFDNSGKEHRLIAEFDAGRVVHIDGERQPNWFVEHVLEKLKP